jgi:hypothetical protein
MNSPNSFDIATYFSALSIDRKLDELIQLERETSPSQLAYNKSCDSLFGLISKLTTNSSADKVAESAIYLKQVARQTDLDRLLRLKKAATQASEVFIFSFLYTEDTELMTAPATIICLRDLFLDKARACSNLADAIECHKDYTRLAGQISQGLYQHLMEHHKRMNSTTVLPGQKLHESISLKISGNETEFTHPSQIYPVLDMHAMTLSSCADANAKLSQISQLVTPHDITPSHIIGDTTNLVVRRILAILFPTLGM